MNSNKRTILLFSILLIILVVILERVLYVSGRIALEDKIQVALLEAMEDGFNIQYRALGFYEAGFKMDPDREFEHCRVISAEGEKVEDILKDNGKPQVGSEFDDKINHTVLSKEGIDIDACLSLWSQKLSEANIASCHALQIHVHADSAHVLACGDSTLFSPRYKKVGNIYAGRFNEIEVESFIRYTWFTAIKNSSKIAIIVGELLLLILLFVCFVYIRKKTKKDVSSTEATSVEDVSQSVISLANLRYVCILHEFYVDHRKIQVRSQSASLLLLFLRAPSHSVSKEEIIACLWSPGDYGVEDRVRRAVSDLRALFRDESVNISIKYSGNSYYLVA